MNNPSPSLPKVSRTTLVDEVIGAIRRMVAEEGWSPETKLPSEQELGRQLGVGRSTVREALRVLGHLGVVESRSGLGTYVVNQHVPPHGRPLEHPQTPRGLYELYEFRRHLEVPAARAAAEKRTADQLAAIKGTWHDCAQAVLKNSPMEFARLDYRFHLSIIEASQNRFAVEAYKTIDQAFPQYVQLILGLGPLRSMLTFHDDLIAAIEARNGDAAEAAALENFMETDVRVQLLLQAEQGPASAS
ncbi:MAG: FadR/GntR family transcriptional regulator [Variibacter sp.]